MGTIKTFFTKLKRDYKGRYVNWHTTNYELELIKRCEIAEKQVEGLKQTIRYLSNMVENQQKQLRLKDELLLNKTLK